MMIVLNLIYANKHINVKTSRDIKKILNIITYASENIGFFFFLFSAIGLPSSSTIKSSASVYSPSSLPSSKVSASGL